MLTDDEIARLISLPKVVVKQEPASGLVRVGRQRRANIELLAKHDQSKSFFVFIRQHEDFTENFSIGLRYETHSPTWGKITLLRFNGTHGARGRALDGHFSQPHIHRMTANILTLDGSEPPESDRQVTDRYSTLEEAIVEFAKDTSIEPKQKKHNLFSRRMFNGS